MSESDRTPETGEMGRTPVDPAAGTATDGELAMEAPEYAAPATSGAVDRIAGEGIGADRDFREHYRLLFASVALFVGTTMLPIEGRHLDLYAKDSISGGFLAIFAAYGILAAWMNIHSRKMIVWPMFFAAVDGLYVATMRVLQLVNQAQAAAAPPKDAREWVNLFGPGCYVIAICSLWVLWTLFTAVMAGAKKDSARKEAAKAARGAKR